MGPEMMLFPREIGLRRARCDSQEHFEQVIGTLRDKSSCYTSLYSFRKMNRDGYRKRFDYSTAVIDRAWWDFDGHNGEDQVKLDAAALIRRLGGCVLAVATGRGFHIHQILREPVCGDRWPVELARYEKEMADGLATLDCVGTVDRLCRVPDTMNPRRGRWAVIIDAEAFAADPLGYEIPTKPDPTLSHLNPFNKHQSDFSLVRWVNKNPAQYATSSREAILSDISSTNNIPIMPCLNSIYQDNPGHHVRVALGQHLVEILRDFADPEYMNSDQKKKVVDGATEFIRNLKWRDFNERITRTQLESIVMCKQAPSCRWFAGRGMCPGPCWRYDGSI